MWLLGIDNVIYHFKVALGTEMRQQHWWTENSLALQESCRINLEAAFIFQLVCINLHFSLSFFSISYFHFSLLIYLEVSENCGNPCGSWESPACHRHVGSKWQGVSRCSRLWCLLVGWEWASTCEVIVVEVGSLVELGFSLTEGWQLVIRAAVRSSLIFCVKSGAPQDSMWCLNLGCLY